MIKQVVNNCRAVLGSNDIGFLERVYQTDPNVYRNRLRAIGFEGLGKILDAGCGFGQWTMAMAALNEHAAGTDISSDRLQVCTEVARALDVKNIEFRKGALEAQPYNDSEFDAVFCYAAVFISYPHLVLKEFHRVLKPGGRLYVNANGLGYTLNLWVNAPNATADYDPREMAAKAFINTVNYRSGQPKSNGQIIIEKEEMLRLLNDAGFETLHCDGEGKINITNNKVKIDPFFPSEYFGFTGVFEVLAQKK